MVIRNVPIFILLAFQSILFSQSIRIKNCIPQIGDTFYRSTIRDNIHESYFDRGNQRFWNLNSIKAPYTIMERYLAASKGRYYSFFPEATMVLKKANGEETYFRTMSGELMCMGEVMKCSFNKTGFMIGKYEIPRRMFPAKGEVGTRFTNDVDLVFIISRNDILGKYSFIPEDADSLEVKINTKQQTGIDDFGTILLHDESHNVIKSTSTTYSLLYTRIKSKKNKKWQNHKMVANALPDELESMISATQWIEVKFYSEKYVGPIVSYKKNNEGITSFESQTKYNADQIFDYNFTDISIYPNPTFGEITVELFNYPRGDYRLEIYNILGKKVLIRDFSLQNQSYRSLDVSELKKGTYLYCIIDRNNRKLVTRRLSVVAI